MTTDNQSGDAAVRRKKLRFRSWRRGFREIDLLLGNFADAHLEELSEQQLDVYEQLLDVPDNDLYDWITGRAPTPAIHDTDVMALIRNIRYRTLP